MTVRKLLACAAILLLISLPAAAQSDSTKQRHSLGSIDPSIPSIRGQACDSAILVTAK